ncbi:MAG: hypothetical protein MR416_09775 [Lachnospiraceae bacterium]|nr:hypothetical protein [Lachnospiraceae bacterium]MDY5541978.1 hypothetical protein [Lachnospiraceae bacterium]
MENIIWYIIMVPCSAVFTIIGIYAWNRKKPMWFWSGSTVEETEIADIPAYNRANGRMWIVFSLPLWLSTFLGLWNEMIALILLAVDLVIGLPVLMIVYKRIYAKYKA